MIKSFFKGRGRIRTGALVTVAAALLSGCATIRGSQYRPPQLQPVSGVVNVSTAVERFHSSDDAVRGGLSKLTYRNVMLLKYSQIIEANYNSFTDQLYAGDRGTALGFDLLQLGLTGATGLVAPSAVDELTMITALAAGARASIDKRLFYDRTITALVSSMDAERTSIKADIARKRKLTEAEYSLEDAVDDLNRLVDAGNINRAFAKITRNAEADRAFAEARLNNISAACENINAKDAELTRDFRLFVQASEANRTAAAAAMKVDLPAGEDPVDVLLDNLATKYCGNASKQELLAQLNPPEDDD